jgi:ubiquinone/menaquinone biosynthesis C-methylase UbiE
VDETRRAWLAERRAAVVADYDDDAPTYDDEEYTAEVQARFVQRLAETCPPGGLVLDAPCGTGRYFAIVSAAGRRVVGIDQSAGMLAVARRRGIADRLVHVGLQELTFDHAFDATMTVDAMENVPPEDWSLVLGNLHRAVRPGGHIYLTVEEQDEGAIADTFAELQRRGVPAVLGEVVEGDVAGYHYYPGRDRVLSWVADEGLTVVDDDFDQQEGWGYRHLLLRDVPVVQGQAPSR